jgi:hypothetical protein
MSSVGPEKVWQACVPPLLVFMTWNMTSLPACNDLNDLKFNPYCYHLGKDPTCPHVKSVCDLFVTWVMYVQVNDANTMVGTPGELLSRRCVTLLKTALKPDVWPQQCDLKLNWFDKVFASVESGSPNYGNICTALELLTFLLGVMKKEQILASCKPLQRGIAACITCSNSKVQDMVSLRRGEVQTHCHPPTSDTSLSCC